LGAHLAHRLRQHARSGAAIGFDDAFIYDEMPKRPAERILPMQHAPSDEAETVFRDWLNKPDRIAY
jgi:hypothetical protein